MSWRKFFRRYNNFFFEDPNYSVKLLISANLGVYLAWQVSPEFMWKHFIVSEVNTIRNHKYYTIFTSAFSHNSLMPMALNCATVWFFGNSLISSIRNSGVITLYFAGALANYLGVYYNSKSRRYSVPVTFGAQASTASILAYFILKYPFEKIYFFIFPVPAFAFGLFTLYLASSGTNNSILYGGFGGALFYLASLIRK
jgi:membrane associated rhomboid family serine protease